MFRDNQGHIQPPLWNDWGSLPEEQRHRLDESWAGVFYREFFCRLDERPFAVLYSDEPSRPNVPVNVLVGLEALKAGFGWSDAEMYDAFAFDLQVRYAVGYRNLADGSFDLRTVYNFRGRLLAHMAETGENLLEAAFGGITDEQIRSFQLKTGKLRMDSTQIASNIERMSRLQLLVEVVQRIYRMLGEADQARYAERFAPYLKGSSGQYIYRLKGEESTAHLERIGQLMAGCLRDLAGTYGDHPTYAIAKRAFGEHFTVVGAGVQAKAGKEISPGALRSPDDTDATFRIKGRGKAAKRYSGYVANVTDTADPTNPFQLIVAVQTAPNTTEDTTMLVEVLPELKERTGVGVLYNDSNYCGPKVDEALRERGVVQVPSQVKGKEKNPEALHLDDFQFTENSHGEVVGITCPGGQGVPVEPGEKPGRCFARFEAAACAACPFQERCPARVRKKDGRRALKFSEGEADIARRRQRCAAYRQEGKNPRAAIEATIGALKRPFPGDKLPVRGLIRVGMMVIGSAAMVNVRRIQRHLAAQVRPIGEERAASGAKGTMGTAISLLSALLSHHFQPPRWRSLSCQAA